MSLDLQLLVRSIHSLMFTASSEYQKLLARREGAEEIAGVRGREATEDMEYGIDRVMEDLVLYWAEHSGHAVSVFSEHGLLGVSSSDAELRVRIDPFDGSGYWRRGVPYEHFLVLSVEDAASGLQLVGCGLDFIRREIVTAVQGEGVFIRTLGNFHEVRVSPLALSGLTPGGEECMSAYFGDPLYWEEWSRRGAILRERFPRIRFWPHGGACAYPWIAAGRTALYAMFGEPRSEIDPGIAFARIAGFPVVSVQPDGTLVPYEPAANVEELGERVPILVAACNPEYLESFLRELIWPFL